MPSVYLFPAFGAAVPSCLRNGLRLADDPGEVSLLGGPELLGVRGLAALDWPGFSAIMASGDTSGLGGIVVSVAGAGTAWTWAGVAA